jgi:hypothetical protein
MKKFLFSIVVIVFLIFGGLCLYSFMQPPIEGKTSDEARAIGVALQNIGVEVPNWQTIIVCSSCEINLSRQTVWEAWSRLEDWQRWSPQLIKSAEWCEAPGWKRGARFRQTIDLGFPVGQIESAETVNTVIQGLTVGWQSKTESNNEGQVWLFEDVSEGKTRVTHVGILQGSVMWFIKPLIIGRWQAKFDSGLEGLMLKALRAGR